MMLCVSPWQKGGKKEKKSAADPPPDEVKMKRKESALQKLLGFDPEALLSLGERTVSRGQ